MFKWPSWRRWKMLIDRYTKAVLVVYPFQDALLSHLLQKNTHMILILCSSRFDWQFANRRKFLGKFQAQACQAARDIMKQARRKWLFCAFLPGEEVGTLHGFFYTSPDMDVFWKWWGFPPKSSILIWFSIINHPFWGTPILRNIHISNVLSCYFNFMLGKCWDLYR